MSASDKNVRYDRQLRLWGDHGQKRLEDAKLLLINGDATGTEILKNLVLPGIGSFTVLDGKKIDEADLGNNFFVEVADIGKSRAEITTKNLNELNSFVHGSFATEDPVSLINNNIEYFKSFSVVIASNLAEQPLLKLAAFLHKNNIPLVVARSYGFLGYTRLVIPEHTVVEPKKDSAGDDLWLHQPFAELADFVDKFDFNALDDIQFSHVPYVIVLLKLIKEWQNQHDGKKPSNSAEKNEFKKRVTAFARNIMKDDNIVEAANNAHKLYGSSAIPSDVRNIFGDDAVKNITAQSPNFWVICRAIKDFVENEGAGLLPVSGDVPDMVGDTQTFLRLQNVYSDKAATQFNIIYNRVQHLLTTAGRDPKSISESEAKLYCKNARFLSATRYRTLEQEYTKETAPSLTFESEEENGGQLDNKLFYVALRAAERFNTIHKHYPGEHDVEQDLNPFKEVVASVCSDLSLDASAVPEVVIQEMVRFGATELHPIAAIIGGVVSQEVVKIVSQQYTPVNNTWILNGINSTSTSFEA
eukprot:TRINITY_DN12358_c0_g1_i1.p1 TRINITY_DN12358_c0_g1~~TRINITY_DN12358_c0_g1_i1.p1  ORF type:complete len:528 (-),score=135.34 TRINITY_DN12358_c0_g1_i1:30-1613(-)